MTNLHGDELDSQFFCLSVCLCLSMSVCYSVSVSVGLTVSRIMNFVPSLSCSQYTSVSFSLRISVSVSVLHSAKSAIVSLSLCLSVLINSWLYWISTHASANPAISSKSCQIVGIFWAVSGLADFSSAAVQTDDLQLKLIQELWANDREVHDSICVRGESPHRAAQNLVTKELETPCCHTVKTRSLCLTLALIGTWSCQTDRQNDIITIASTCLPLRATT